MRLAITLDFIYILYFKIIKFYDKISSKNLICIIPDTFATYIIHMAKQKRYTNYLVCVCRRFYAITVQRNV